MTAIPIVIVVGDSVSASVEYAYAVVTDHVVIKTNSAQTDLYGMYGVRKIMIIATMSKYAATLLACLRENVCVVVDLCARVTTRNHLGSIFVDRAQNLSQWFPNTLRIPVTLRAFSAEESADDFKQRLLALAATYFDTVECLSAADGTAYTIILRGKLDCGVFFAEFSGWDSFENVIISCGFVTGVSVVIKRI